MTPLIAAESTALPRAAPKTAPLTPGDGGFGAILARLRERMAMAGGEAGSDQAGGDGEKDAVEPALEGAADEEPSDTIEIPEPPEPPPAEFEAFLKLRGASDPAEAADHEADVAPAEGAMQRPAEPEPVAPPLPSAHGPEAIVRSRFALPLPPEAARQPNPQDAPEVDAVALAGVPTGMVVVGAAPADAATEGAASALPIAAAGTVPDPATSAAQPVPPRVTTVAAGAAEAPSPPMPMIEAPASPGGAAQEKQATSQPGPPPDAAGAALTPAAPLAADSALPSAHGPEAIVRSRFAVPPRPAEATRERHRQSAPEVDAVALAGVPPGMAVVGAAPAAAAAEGAAPTLSITAAGTVPGPAKAAPQPVPPGVAPVGAGADKASSGPETPGAGTPESAQGAVAAARAVQSLPQPGPSTDAPAPAALEPAAPKSSRIGAAAGSNTPPVGEARTPKASGHRHEASTEPKRSPTRPVPRATSVPARLVAARDSDAQQGMDGSVTANPGRAPAASAPDQRVTVTAPIALAAAPSPRAPALVPGPLPEASEPAAISTGGTATGGTANGAPGQPDGRLAPEARAVIPGGDAAQRLRLAATAGAPVAVAAAPETALVERTTAVGPMRVTPRSAPASVEGDTMPPVGAAVAGARLAPRDPYAATRALFSREALLHPLTERAVESHPPRETTPGSLASEGSATPAAGASAEGPPITAPATGGPDAAPRAPAADGAFGSAGASPSAPFRSVPHDGTPDHRPAATLATVASPRKPASAPAAQAVARTMPQAAPVTAPAANRSGAPAPRAAPQPAEANEPAPKPAEPKTADRPTPAAPLPDPPPDTAPRPDAAARFDPAPVPHTATAPQAETAHRIAQQIAVRLDSDAHRGFDLALQPEELGHVRLRLVSHDSGSVLMVHADRPETLDLMRRHIGTLQADLRAMGHEHLSLRFSGGGLAGQGGGQAQAQTPSPGSPQSLGFAGSPPPAPERAAVPTPPVPRGARDHLDLRL